MKIFLDDERQTPEGWVRCYWPDQVIFLLQSFDVTEVSLDHDLGDDDKGTGYDVLLWIERQVVCNRFHPPVLKVHSANTSARDKMNAAISAIARVHARRLRDTKTAQDNIKTLLRSALRKWSDNTFEKNQHRYQRKGILTSRLAEGKDGLRTCSIKTDLAVITLLMWRKSPLAPKTSSSVTLTVKLLNDKYPQPFVYAIDMPNYCNLQRYRIWLDAALNDVYNNYEVY